MDPARTVRIAHATDVHWFSPPPLTRLCNKRFLGWVNLFVGGRKTEFDETVQTDLIEHITALAPDAVLMSGDLTATALEAEFEKARAALNPVLERFPTLVLAGNHDVYTWRAARERRIARYFEPWMGLGGDPEGIARLDVGPVTILGLDPNRPGVLSSGRLPAEQLEGLAEALAGDALAERVVLLALHYPVLDRHGEVYDGLNHGLRNARELIAVLEAAPKRPVAIVHGHEHHGYQVDLALGEDRVPIFDPGAGGYADLPERGRAACMNLYEIAPSGAVRVERYRHGPDGFQPEPGGAYASGR